MSEAFLDSRSSLPPLGECGKALRQLSLERDAVVPPYVANDFISRAFNDPYGRRLVDVSNPAVFKRLRRSLGYSLAWTLKENKVSAAIRNRIADHVGYELSSFVAGRKSSGVRVFRRERDNDGMYHLVPELKPVKSWNRIANGSAVLVPTGVVSPRIADEEVYLRMDVSRSHCKRSMFIASEILFTNSNGRSVAGFADVGEYVVNIDDAHSALSNVFGVEYNEAECNAAIFESWWQHKLAAPNSDIIRVPLRVFDDGEIAMTLNRLDEGGWTASLDVFGHVAPLSEFASEHELVLDSQTAVAEHDFLEAAFKRCFPFGGDDAVIKSAVDLDHVFRERKDRFTLDFQKKIQQDYDAAVEEFIGALRHTLATPSLWETTLYFNGTEKGLAHYGDTANARVQLVFPIFLSDDERDLESPSVYVVGDWAQDIITGRGECVFPTVLTRAQVFCNRTILRRAIRRSA